MALERILKEFPEWSVLVRKELSPGGVEFTVIDVPAPASAQVEGCLSIELGNEEVSVFFDSYHTHYDEWIGDDEYNIGLDAAIAGIKNIIGEKVSAVSWWCDSEWRGSALLKAGETPVAPSAIESFNRIRVRSWNGTWNTL